MALTESAQLDQQQNFYNLGYTSTESAQGTCSSNGLAPVVFSTVKGQTQLLTRSTSFFFEKYLAPNSNFTCHNNFREIFPDSRVPKN